MGSFHPNSFKTERLETDRRTWLCQLVWRCWSKIYIYTYGYGNISFTALQASFFPRVIKWKSQEVLFLSIYLLAFIGNCVKVG